MTGNNNACTSLFVYIWSLRLFVCFVQNLNDTNSSVTSLYLEVGVAGSEHAGGSPSLHITFFSLQSSNSGSYVQDAFQLLIPVLKFTLVQQSLSDEPPTSVMSRN